ncbi:hypothetical protein ACH5RR_002225 [Cinchona calisaya]|uniref:Filament-like plant protein 7 n=1 Tax=Cinchona calisaya TaxID=153742 RepID=A0ABD3B5P7_9GENT
MDQKTWLWRKRSSEKTIIAIGKTDFDLKGKEEVRVVLNEKEAALEESVKILNEKLASLTSECSAKEQLLENHAKVAKEAMAGQEKAETELQHIRKELDEALQQKFAANDRLSKLNVAFKDCMQQLSSLRDEQEQRVNDAIMRISKEFEKSHKKLEEKLSETSKKLANITVENSHLHEALQVKESLIEDLRNSRSQVEAEFDALIVRLDSVEKENAFLRYEFRVLEKDLDVRNEKIEFTRRSAETSQMHYIESMNKIKKLETECQRLRVLVRKRISAPALLANMKSEVESLGRCQIETRRRKSNPVMGGLAVRESARENLDISSKRISFLVERLQNVEQENKILRDLLAKKNSDVSSVSGVNHCDKDETNSSRSWASALISEPDNFKNGDLKNMSQHKMLGISDISLMDDFVEMEKLAIVAVDVPHGSFHASSDTDHTLPDSLTRDDCQNRPDSTGMELVPVGKEHNETHQELQISDLSSTKPCDWLQAVLKVILEQVRLSERSIEAVLEDIKIALHGETYKAASSNHSGQSELLTISGYITWKSPTASPTVGSLTGVPHKSSSLEETNHDLIQSKDLELSLQLARDKSEALTTDLEQSQPSISSLQTQLETLSESKRMIEDQFENQKLINEELDTQFTIAKVRLNDISQKLSSLEIELEDKIHCCEELEGTCLELQLQLESVTSKDILKDDINQEGKLLRTGWEIKTASVKLAECEATILNLGNQLKDLTSPKEASYLNKILSTPSKNNKLKQRFSLLDQMLSEEDTKMEDLKSSETKGLIISTAETHGQSPCQTKSQRAFYTCSAQTAASEADVGLKMEATKTAKAGPLVVVPSKKQGRGVVFLRRLLLWKKRGSSRKKPFSFAT